MGVNFFLDVHGVANKSETECKMLGIKTVCIGKKSGSLFMWSSLRVDVEKRLMELFRSSRDLKVIRCDNDSYGTREFTVKEFYNLLRKHCTEHTVMDCEEFS